MAATTVDEGRLEAQMGRAVAGDQLGAQAGEERLRNQTPFTLILEAHS